MYIHLGIKAKKCIGIDKLNKDECVGKMSFHQTCLLLGDNVQASNMAHGLFWKKGGGEIPSAIEDFFSKE